MQQFGREVYRVTIEVSGCIILEVLRATCILEILGATCILEVLGANTPFVCLSEIFAVEVDGFSYGEDEVG